MIKNPLFSIVTVTLNNFPGLEATWKSLQKQSCRNFEWIVIDGGSKDYTASFLQRTNAHWVSEKDDGIYDAMNKGLDRASGDYILFLNAGDKLTNPYTLDMLHTIAAKNPDFIYGDSYESDGQSKHYKPARANAKIARGMFTHHQSMLYKREVIGDTRFDTKYKIAADYDFTVRFLKNAKAIFYAPVPLCIFESGGISQQNAKTGRREEFLIRRREKLKPLTSAALTYGAQSLAQNLKTFTPNFYWSLKSSRNRAPEHAQNQNPLFRPARRPSKNKSAKTPPAA